MGFIGYSKGWLLWQSMYALKINIYLMFQVSLKRRGQLFSVFIELTLLKKFLLLKYKWSYFPFEVVQWYAINILSKHFSILESYFLFTRSVDRRKSIREFWNLHKVLSTSKVESEVARPLVSVKELGLCCFSPMRRTPSKSHLLYHVQNCVAKWKVLPSCK